MPQTSFSVASGGSLATVLADIGSGTDAAADTAYLITLTASISLLSPPTPSASVSLQSGASVTLQGPYALIVSAFAVTGTLTTDLNFTGTVTLDNGGFINDAVTTVGGVATAGIDTGAVLGTTGDGGDSVVNDGTIQYGGTYAAVELDTGTVQNGWDGTAAALVTGAAVGVQFNTSGLLQNGGTIVATGTGTTAVYLAAGTVDNGQLSQTGALITGGRNGVEIAGAGLVVNDGSIIGGTADAVYLGKGSVQNGAIGDTTARIDGGPADNGVWIGAGTVDNYATISGGGAAGVLLAAGGTVSNLGTAALVSGLYEGVLLDTAGALFNDGTVQAAGDTSSTNAIGAFLVDGGTIDNTGTAALLTGPTYGAVIEGAAGTVSNLGTMQASGASGIGVALYAGGTIVNAAGASISGNYDGVALGAGPAGALVRNSGTIEGFFGVDFQGIATPAAGTLVNNGLIESSQGDSGYAAVFGSGAERLVLQAGGAFVGAVFGNDGAGSSTVLELATAGTLGALAADAGTVTDSAGSFGFAEFGTIALDGGATWTIAAPATLAVLTNAGTLAIAGGAAEVTGTLVNSGTITVDPSTLTVDGALTSGGGSGTLVIGANSTVALQDSVDAGQTLDFAPGGAELLTLAIPGSVQAALASFVAGDTIDLRHTTVTGFQYADGTLDVLNGTGTVAVLALPGPYKTADFSHAPDSTDGTFVTTDVMPCYAAGTRILTPRGQIPVEDIAPGDWVIALVDGARVPRRVTWVGRRGINIATHPQPQLAAPVRIRRDAVAAGQPCRDLLVSPDHGLFIDGVLIPAKLLINDMTIVQDRTVPHVTYVHVELEHHAVLLAEGLPAESYLDTGNRAMFAAAGAALTLHPVFPVQPGLRCWQQDACAPLTVAPARVRPVWHRLVARAEALGHTRPPRRTTPDPRLRLVADGRARAAACIDGRRHLFVLPAGARDLRLVSRSAIPSDGAAYLDDWRRLGVAVARLRVHAADGSIDIPPDHPDLRHGWHAAEAGAGAVWRWTDGCARLPVAVAAVPRLLDVRLHATLPYTEAAGLSLQMDRGRDAHDRAPPTPRAG
jgi:hypothetical protein